MPFAEACRYEATLFGLVASTDDMREGTKAFLEKRTPVFTGRLRSSWQLSRNARHAGKIDIITSVGVIHAAANLSGGNCSSNDHGSLMGRDSQLDAAVRELLKQIEQR